jgi:predicted enzyme related to lactoylglutathione lyase
MKGVYTVIYTVPNLTAAKDWYSRAFGVDPYFDEPFYVGFDIEGFELGLLPESEERRAGPGGTVGYWGVDDARSAVDRLLELGAELNDEVSDVGEGILVGSVRNVVGIIQNPGFRR